MITRRIRLPRHVRPLALLFGGIGLALLQSVRAPELSARAQQPVVVASASTAAPDAGLIQRSSRPAELAVASTLNGGTQFVELSTRASRSTGNDAGNHRDHAAGAANLHIQQTFRNELNYRTLLLRRRSGADPGYTSTPPPTVQH